MSNSAPPGPDGQPRYAVPNSTTRDNLNNSYGAFMGNKGMFIDPSPPPSTVPEQNPFQALAPSSPSAPATQPSAPAQNFDALVDSILNEPSPVQGADTPMTPEAPKADKPKQSPLFGDLNVHIQPNTTPLTQDDRDRNAMSPRESIF